ncbi:MAG TPA: FAD-dependent oxidoreductase [Sandaracinaceae bacterium]
MERHVVVVGAGVIGLFCALHCALRGFRVTVVERSAEERDGCSFGNTGMIVPSHFVPLAAPGMVAQAVRRMLDPAAPFHVKPRLSWSLLTWGLRFARACRAERARRAALLLRDLALASRSDYEALAREDNAFCLEPRGALMLCRTGQALEEEARVAEQARELGMPADVLDRDAAQALEPGVEMDVVGAVRYPLDCNLVPERLVAALQRRLVQHGVRFLWKTEVKGWDTEADRLRAAVCTRGTRIDADAFVLAAGSWSPQLARTLALPLALQPGKGYSLTCRRPPQTPRHCAVLVEARVSVSPMDGALRFGGTMEIAGLDERINPVRVRSIVAAIPRYFPQFAPADFDTIEPWRGLRPCSPDGLPYIGRSARYPNLVIATGHAMLGVSLAPVTGRIVSRVLLGEESGFDLALLSPDRYGP